MKISSSVRDITSIKDWGKEKPPLGMEDRLRG